ncbi:MAG: YHS domain-containing protein [Planctomycetes bacterium]|nr:YHS domain-containing protein [Planctomycetota bacterium]
MFRYDTVANQREGTSFALNPNDYRERECVISGGLGTSTVSYHGKTYYVCCSGCRDAFNDDPQTWIARFIERKKK